MIMQTISGANHSFHASIVVFVTLLLSACESPLVTVDDSDGLTRIEAYRGDEAIAEIRSSLQEATLSLVMLQGPEGAPLAAHMSTTLDAAITRTRAEIEFYESLLAGVSLDLPGTQPIECSTSPEIISANTSAEFSVNAVQAQLILTIKGIHSTNESADHSIWTSVDLYLNGQLQDNIGAYTNTEDCAMNPIPTLIVLRIKLAGIDEVCVQGRSWHIAQGDDGGDTESSALYPTCGGDSREGIDPGGVH